MVSQKTSSTDSECKEREREREREKGINERQNLLGKYDIPLTHKLYV